MFHSTHAMMTTVIQTMNRPVPRNRAIRSDSRPNASGSHSGSRRRRGDRGWASPGRGRGDAGAPARAGARVDFSCSGVMTCLLFGVELRLPPVLRQHVVEYVVHG